MNITKSCVSLSDIGTRRHMRSPVGYPIIRSNSCESSLDNTRWMHSGWNTNQASLTIGGRGGHPRGEICYVRCSRLLAHQPESPRYQSLVDIDSLLVLSSHQNVCGQEMVSKILNHTSKAEGCTSWMMLPRTSPRSQKPEGRTNEE